MTSNQVEVSLEGTFVLELADVDIEEVDGEGRRQDVGDREDEGQDWNVCQEGDVVSMPEDYVSERGCCQQSLSPIFEVNISRVILERDWEVLFEDEVEDHHHLHRCLDTPADAVSHLKKLSPRGGSLLCGLVCLINKKLTS